MFEVELSLIFFVVGFLFHRYGYPVVKEKLKERWLEQEIGLKRKTWEPCVECGSKTTHKPTCSKNPKNKVKT